MISKEKNNRYNYIVYGLAIAFIVESVLLFYPEVVSTGLTYWGEVCLLIGIFVFGCVYNKIDFELRIQPMFMIVLFWGIWFLAYVKWDMEKPIDMRLYVIGIISLSWILIRQVMDILRCWRDIIIFARNNISIFILIVICFCFILPTVYDVCFYDCGQYYQDSVRQIGASTFEYSFSNIMDYCFRRHTTSGLALFIIWGELINKSFGFKIANYLLYLLSIFCFYRCICKMAKVSNVTSTMATTVYAFSPWCMGLIGQTSLDNPSLYFIPILIYAYIYRRDVLFLLVGWFFVNTKESNIVYYSFFALSIWVLYAVREHKYIHNLSWNALYRTLKKGIYLVIPSAMWLIMYMGFTKSGGWLSYVNSSNSINSTVVSEVSEVVEKVDINAPLEAYIHKVGFTWANFAQKNREMFIYNFSWLWIVLAIISVMIVVLNNRERDFRDLLRDEFVIIIPILTLIISIAVFNWIYLDWDNPRYVMPMAAPLLMITTSIIIRGLRKYSINIILFIGAAFMLIQSFAFIDPSMIVKSKIMSHKDEGMYNRNYRALYVCLNEIMNDIGWKEDYISIRLGEGLCSYGEEIYYDRRKNRVTLSEDNSENIKISYRIDGDCDYYVYDLSREEVPDNLQEVGRYSYSNMILGLYIYN